MKLSVIIPCLDAAATLPIQLEALATQLWLKPWELIIADNGSRDASYRVATEYQERFSNFRIIDASVKKSASYARNVGARAARSENLAFCDADDEVAPGWVAAIGEALGAHDVVYGQFRFDKFNEPGRAKKAADRWKYGLCTGHFLKGGGTGNLGIKRWVHEALGGFDECLPRFEDADYFWRLQLEGYELFYVPEAIVQVRIGRINPSFSLLQRRGRHRAAANYWLYKRYRKFGMRHPQTLKDSLVTWLRHIKKITRGQLIRKQQRDEWLTIFAQQTGNLMGELHGRMANPCKPYRNGTTNLRSGESLSYPRKNDGK